MSEQLLDVALTVNVPVNMSNLGRGGLVGQPFASVLALILAVIILFSVLAIPSLEIFESKVLSPYSRSLEGSDFALAPILEALTGSKAVEDFLNEPLDDFLERVLGGQQDRSFLTVKDVSIQTGQALRPFISSFDYEDAFQVVQVPGTDCRQRLMCYAHSQIQKLPSFLQQAYSFVGPQLRHYQNYTEGIFKGLSGGDCGVAFPECPYNIVQMASFVPILKSNINPLGVKNEL